MKKMFFLAALASASVSFGYPTDSIYKYFQETRFTISVNIEGKGKHCLLATQEGTLKMEACQDSKWAVNNKAELWQVSPYLSASGGYVHLYLLNGATNQALSHQGAMISFEQPNGMLNEDVGRFLFWDLNATDGFYSGYFNSDPMYNNAIASYNWKNSEYTCMTADLANSSGTYYVSMKKTALDAIDNDCMGFEITKYEGQIP